MTRPSLSPATAWPMPVDLVGLLMPWFELQHRLFDTTLAQWHQSQEMLLKSWIAAAELGWGPWTPFVARGGEQAA